MKSKSRNQPIGTWLQTFCSCLCYYYDSLLSDLSYKNTAINLNVYAQSQKKKKITVLTSAPCPIAKHTKGRKFKHIGAVG